MTDVPSPFELHRRAGGDSDEYRRLMVEHGLLVPKLTRAECVEQGGHFWPACDPGYGSVLCTRIGYDPGWVASATEYRVEFDDKPRSFWDDPDNDGLWDTDRSLVEEEAEIHRALGATNVRIVERSVDAAGQKDEATDA